MHGLSQRDRQRLPGLRITGLEGALVRRSGDGRRCWGRGRRRRGLSGAGSHEQQGDAAGPQDPATTNGLPPSRALIRAAAAWASARVAKLPARTL